MTAGHAAKPSYSIKEMSLPISASYFPLSGAKYGGGIVFSFAFIKPGVLPIPDSLKFNSLTQLGSALPEVDLPRSSLVRVPLATYGHPLLVFRRELHFWSIDAKLSLEI